MALSETHFEDAAAFVRQRDPALYAELKSKFSSLLPDVLLETTRKLRIAPETPLVGDRGEITPKGRMVLETIVKAHARPVLIIRENRATTEFLGPDSEVWAHRIAQAQTILDSVIPAVGRIDLKNNPDFQWVGTGWMVASDIIVTNRHVAREFSRRGPDGFIFRLGLNGALQEAQIDFLEEFRRTASLEFQVQSILWISDADGPDVAFLRAKRISTAPAFPPPLTLADNVEPDALVATIGYPARDPRVPDQDLVRKIFGDVYDKKRLAPGQLTEVKNNQLEHDCSTLGGNSGSAVVSLDTGQAVGLHFSGLFMQANFAVPSTIVRELLAKVERGAPRRMTPNQLQLSSPVQPIGMPGTHKFHLDLPIDITVKVGTPCVIDSATFSAPSSRPTDSPEIYEHALDAAREMFAGVPGILQIRLGYRFKNGWITDEHVVVAEVREKLDIGELRTNGIPVLPREVLGVGVDVRTAALNDQLEALGIDIESLEGRSKAGLYREPTDLKLESVRENMRAIFHVSPDSGFPNLKAFLGRVTKRLTATIYEWQPTHISDAIEAAMQGSGRTLKMVTQPHIGIAEGTEDAVNDMRSRIGNKFEHVYASVGSGKLIPSAYHIKVASRDGEEFWLSSGNWKDSNQADIDPAGEHSHAIGPLRQHNREWHAIIENRKLATLFQEYIEFDFEEAQRVPFEEVPFVFLPDVFIPEEAFLEMEARPPIHYFDPLVLDRELEIQPLLTPDRNSHHEHIFIKFATQLATKASKRIYVQNQSFSISEDQQEYEDFFATLRDQQKAGLDVRIIFRDPREFPRGRDQLQTLLERIKKFGIDTQQVTVQRKCHTKGIIVDGKAVILGSQNLTAGGSLFNRDASLLVRDQEVAAYFEKIFVFDWETLAIQESDELVGGIRLAQPGENTPIGYKRVPLSELISSD